MRARSTIASAMALAALWLAAPGHAQEAGDASWLAVLRLQLRDNNHCQIDKVLFSRQIPLGADVGLEGRVACVDGREYDFSRQRPHEKFDIRLCQPTVC